jgi:K(+)-stimulated pyrophosphate-energized sodium pump
VALNPVIKFTTLFGLLAVELAVTLNATQPNLGKVLSLVFFLISFVFVYRSFYRMRIGGSKGASNEQNKALPQAESKPTGPRPKQPVGIEAAH